MTEQATYVTLPIAGPQQWRALTAYTFHCLGCDRPLCGEWDDPAWFAGTAPITGYDLLDDQGWGEVGNGRYCPDCFHVCYEADEQNRLGPEESCAVCREAMTCKTCRAYIPGTADCPYCLYGASPKTEYGTGGAA